MVTYFFTNLSHFILTEDITRKDISEGYITIDFKGNSKDVQSFIIIIPKNENGDNDLYNAKVLNDPTKFYIHSFSKSENNYDIFKSSIAVEVFDPLGFYTKIKYYLNKLFSCDVLLKDDIYYYNDASELKALGVANWANPVHKSYKYKNEDEYRFYFYAPVSFHENKIAHSESKADMLIYRYKIKVDFDMSEYCRIIKGKIV